MTRKWGIKFNVDKIQLMTNCVKYLGKRYTEEGVSPDKALTKAILKMREPRNQTKVQQGLGLGSYLTEFIPNLANMTSLFRKLLYKNNNFEWGEEEKISGLNFKNVKDVPQYCGYATHINLLYYTVMPVRMVKFQNSTPVAYASRCLNKTDRKRAGSLFCMSSVPSVYTYSHKITMFTDHKPLITTFQKEINDITVQLQQFKFGLLKYDIGRQFVPG